MNTNIDMTQIGKNIRKLRELHNLTRLEFCEKMYYDVNYWGSIERGERIITLQKLLEVSNFFNVSVDTIVDLEITESPDTNTIVKITDKLNTCNNKQLNIISKFIDDIIPYT